MKLKRNTEVDITENEITFSTILLKDIFLDNYKNSRDFLVFKKNKNSLVSEIIKDIEIINNSTFIIKTVGKEYLINIIPKWDAQNGCPLLYKLFNSLINLKIKCYI